MTDKQIIAMPFFVLIAICVLAPLLVHHYKQKKDRSGGNRFSQQKNN